MSSKKKVAIYARYSTGEQNESSIEDQVRECLNYAESNDMEVPKDYIFCDQALSGQDPNRPGFKKLIAVTKSGELDAVLIFSVDRLSRDTSDALKYVKELAFTNSELIIVSSGMKLSDSQAEIVIGFQAMIAQQYVQNIRLHTRRGQVGQIERGYVAGNLPYGYQTEKVFAEGSDRKGRNASMGSVPNIIESEAVVIRRIYKEYLDGKTVDQIAKQLNEDKVPTRYKKGWNNSTVDRILRSESYRGIYIWGSNSNKRDPSTGKKVKVKTSVKQSVRKEMEALRIISDDDWNDVRKRLDNVRMIAPKNLKGGIQVSRQTFHPEHLLAANVKCGVCGGAYIQKSGKNGGYFGCRQQKFGRCNNSRLLKRSSLEQSVVDTLRSQVLTSEVIERVFNCVLRLIKAESKIIPGDVLQSKKELRELETKIAKRIGILDSSPNISSIVKDLEELEARMQVIQEKIDAQLRASKALPLPPDRGWIDEQVTNLFDLLKQDNKKSALILRELLDTLIITPVEKDGKLECHKVKSKLKTFAIFPEGDKGSTQWQMWTWWEPIRTISDVPFEVNIPMSKPFLFQTLSEAATTLKHQGLSYLAISKILNIDDKTVKKAIERSKKLVWLLFFPFSKS